MKDPSFSIDFSSDFENLEEIPKQPAWQKEIHEFLKNWTDSSPTIPVKTSGSTGTPKSILLQKSAMRKSAQLTGQFFDFQKNKTALLCLPVGFIAGKMMVVRAHEFGMKLIAVRPSGNPVPAIDSLIDFAAMTPMQVANGLDVCPEKFEFIAQLIIGGAPVSPSLEKKLQSIPTACYATYGMTETITHVALRKLNQPAAENFYTGLSGIHFSQDERDCLLISAAHFGEKPIITNDVVAFEGANKFRWLGRFDHVINSGGVKLFPEAIEKKIAPFIEDRFFVSHKEDPKLGQAVVLIIESEESNPEKVQSIKSIFDSTLDKYEHPKFMFFHPKFAETENGKIQREQTRKLVVPKP